MDEHKFEPKPVACTNSPDCPSEYPYNLSERDVYRCPACERPFCQSCAARFTICDNCGESICVECIKLDKNKDQYLCKSCLEEGNE